MPKRKKKLKHKAHPRGVAKQHVSVPTIDGGKVELSKWDMGTGTAAAMQNTKIEPADFTDPETGEKVNPNGVVRRRRQDAIDKLYERNAVTFRQHAAGKHLRDLWESTQRSPPAIQEVRVDQSPKPDQAIDTLIDRQSKLMRLSQMVPAAAVTAVHCVIYDDRSISTLAGARSSSAVYKRHLRLLREALDILADEMGLERE